MSLPYSVDGHTDCDAPLGVVVHQRNGTPIRLPVIDDGLQFYERKVGPTAITRRAEVTIPIEDNSGTNWIQYVNGFTPTAPSTDRVGGSTTSTGIPTGNTSATGIQIADVIGQPIDNDGDAIGQPEVLFRGYTAAVGSTEGTNRARLRIDDPKQFLSNIEAGVSFQDVTPRDVLRYVQERFTTEQTVFNDVSIAVADVPERVIPDEIEPLETTRRILNNEKIFGEVITFSSNRDTLTDVLGWLSDAVDARVWFEPSGEQGITLRVIADDTQTYDLTPSSETPPRVIANNSLYEMAPFNALKLKGSAKKLLSVGSLTISSPVSDSYPEATARYPPLVERYGGELSQTDTSDVSEADALEREVASRLKEELDTVSGGEIVTTLAPMVRPYDRLLATPACAGVTADVDPLRYEVQEAVHSVTPSDNNLPQTTLSVSMAIDASKIEAESTVKDARTGEEPSDTDSNKKYEYDYQTAP